MERQQYIQDLVNQNLTDEEIFAKLDEFDNDTDPPKKNIDPLKQETSTGSQDMVSKSVDGSLGLQGPSMGPAASLEEQFGFEPLEPPKNIERMQEVVITVPKSREDLTWLERKFGKNKITDFFGDIVRSWESGWTAGESVDVNLELWKEGTTREEINSFIQMDERLSKVKSTDELIEFEKDYQKLVEEDGAALAFFEGWFKNPEAMLQTSMQSASMMVSSLVNSDEVGANAITGLTTGGGIGAGVGSVVPGIGTLAGGLTGAASGAQGAISGTMEVGFTMAELVKEKAIEDLKESGSDKNWNELSSKKRGDLVYEILSNKKTKQELKDRALARGVTIGGFDAISGAVTMGAGRFASGAAKNATRTAFKSSSRASQAVLRTTAKAAPTTARFTTETGISMLGEGAGQLAAGQELDVKEILTEGFADKTFTTIGLGKDVAVSTFSKGKYKINGQNLSFNKFANEIKAMDDVAFSNASIDVKNDDVVDAIVNNRAEDIKIDQGIDSKISDVNDRAELIKLERDIKQLSASDSETNKNRVAKLKERVKEISEAYADAEVDIEIEDRKNSVAQASRNKVEREFNDNAKKVEQAAEDIKDLEILKFDTTKEVEEYLASREGDEISSKASGQQGFIIQDSSGKQTIVLNKEVAVKDNAVTVASHELLHGLLFSTINKNPNNAVRLGDALLKRLNNIDINKIKDSKFKERMELYADESRDIKMEEALTLFSDALATGDIKYNENVFTRVGDVIRRTLQRNNKINIKFNNGRDVYNFIKDYNNSIQEGKLSLAQEKLAEEGATGRLISEQKETEGLTVKESKAKATVLEEINNLIPENIETKEQFLSDRSFTKIYESAMNPGGAINNYIKSRTTSAMEAELAIDSVLERLINFDPQAKRKDGSIIGREGFGEFVFANTAFGKLDAKKKLFQESERRSKETSIDESTKQIADVETTVEEQVETKEKPKINPLKFTGVPAEIKLSDKPGKGLTFKKVAKQYAGEVGEQAIGIPAKKITESAANLGSVNEARAIQQFFFKADNLDKFVKILPETNIALPETQIGIETIDVSKGVQGTGLGLPKRILDYFYEDFIDPTGKLTSPKGRSKGLTSQTAVKRLKPEFRGIVSKETIDKIKKDIGITPKGELNILPKGELRSPIGQLLKGMAKTYSTLAANTLVRQEMEAAGATKQEVADVAAGKPRVMLSKKVQKVQKELGSTRTIKDVYKVLKDNGVDLKDINTTKEIDILHSEIEEIIKLGGITLEMFRSAKFTNFGVKTVYGEFNKDGKFVEFSKKEKAAKGSNKLKFKYYALKNNEFVKVPVKKNQLGNLVEDKEKADKIKKSRSGDFTPDRSDIYYGTEDPAYKRAEELARQNTELEAKKPKRVSVKKAGTKEANEQFATNLDVLEEMTIKLADAVNNKKLSADAAVKFITKAYQATSGVIKISAPFKYKTMNPKYAGEYGKPEQNKGELIREEHTVPASVIGGYLIHGILTNTAKEAMSAVRKNFFQVVLGKQYDVILDKAKLDATLAEGSSLFDENVGAIRMLTANILTENIENLPRMNFNDIVNIETNESWAKEIGVTLPKEYETVDNLNLQNRLLLDKIKGEGEYSNHQEYLNEHVKLKTEEAAAANQSRLKNVTSKFSKKKDLSNKKILNDLSNRDKALRNARNVKAKVKGISVFDFDDTLATSKSKVIVNMPASEVQKITGTGDATKIIRTVYDGAVSLISKKKEIKKLNFAADFSEPSRVKLYNTLAKKLEKELGWDLDVFEEFTFGKKTQEDFELTRPEGAKDVKPRDSDLEFTENEIGGFEASFNIDDKQYNVYMDFRGEGDYDLSFKLVEESETFEITPEEFAKRGEELLKQGAEFDFTQFSEVVDGKPGPLIAKLDKAIKKFGNKDVFVLTARPANSASAIYEFLKGLGYEIPLENITGLANSSPEAKAQWMVDKAAEGYNDFYFTDDAYKNVKAVQDAMKVLDVKSKERIVYKDAYEKLDKEFNDILEAKTGIASEKRYSDAKAEVIGVSKGKFNFFISPSAEDFVGLLYSTLSKGKLGENQMAWYKKNLLDPYTRAMNNIANERMSLAADYKALKKQLGVVPKKLKQKIKGEGFNKEQAIRIYIWNKQGFDVPGLSKTDLADMTKYVENDATLKVFADQLVEITKGDGYATPSENWMAGSITTDLLSTLQVTKRAKHLEEWQQNVDVIFSKENLNKMEAAYGSTYRGAMENMLQRMKSGKNRNFDGDSLTGKFLDWVNGSTGAIMFFNTRSAILQTISAVNFINWSDNNVFKASAAFANQKQYWKDFMFLFNSDFLKERRDNLTINVNEADIAEMANKGGAKGALAYLLQKGFLPTQIADGFAIASGGSTFYRNRIKTYLKEGMSQKEAETKAFEDFREAAEESQQSSRPDRISQQQAGPLGRVVLAFANTPSQYARIIKKASLDLANNRGDFKTNLSKIMYYSVIQGVIFTALQSALFAADFDDEEEMEDRIWRMSNSVVDGIMRGAGVQGAVTSVVKNATLKAIEESEKKSPKYNKVVNEIVRISPPVSSKISKLQQAAREVQWNRKEMETKGFSLDNPAWLAAGNVISATTNVPADRVIKKINNVDYALNQELELYERLALLGGWQKWELGLEGKSKNKKIKAKGYRGSFTKSKSLLELRRMGQKRDSKRRN